MRVSKEFGFNSSVQVCPCCGKDMGVLLLETSYKENGEVIQDPPQIATGELCDDCKKVIENGGIFFIEVRDGEQQRYPQAPYRTGRVIGVHREWVEKHIKEFQAINFMEQSLYTSLFGKVIEEV